MTEQDSDTGCTKMNAMCKVWLCLEAREINQDCSYVFDFLERIRDHYKLID